MVIHEELRGVIGGNWLALGEHLGSNPRSSQALFLIQTFSSPPRSAYSTVSKAASSWRGVSYVFSCPPVCCGGAPPADKSSPFRHFSLTLDDWFWATWVLRGDGWGSGSLPPALRATRLGGRSRLPPTVFLRHRSSAPGGDQSSVLHGQQQHLYSC